MTECKVLPYDMGNAGDLIKHGALALFVQWWCENNRAKTLRFADPFGGIPYEREVKPVIKERLKTLSAEQPFVAECLWDGDTYRNSGHIVAKAARECGKLPEVWTSDKCLDRRDQLATSGLCMLGEKYKGYENDDGYSILTHAGDFDLVLIDPFKQFWAEQRKGKLPCLEEIKQTAEESTDACIAVFLAGKSGASKEYNRMKQHLKNTAISLRCLKIQGSARGEKGRAEIILFSQAFADKGRELHERLVEFKHAAQKVLPLGDKEIEIHPPE